MTKSDAIKWAGNITQLAARLGITESAVRAWPGERIPMRRQFELWRLSAGALEVDEPEPQRTPGDQPEANAS